MDYKKSKAPVNTVTRDLASLWEETGNIYESVSIIAKRANQIGQEIKQDLNKKLAEFASYNDSLEEVFENREQIEISRYYEKLPKPTLLATEEFLQHQIYWRDPSQDNQNED
ncbi:DNA-directed RNA polymerase subunit omega [Segatella albensis]|jgi:DNA-directed RNA polymerase subunit K/omega|uniref:DNA-directed RNA polymerase subunit omega n=1 Tax=Segatella albensis TaxID=77768 RepID=UPI000468CA64|nr:DNA-directed RNA polymerase subunit omega [Segatella albensis]